MTVSSTTKRNDYEGTGSTDTYSYTFQVFAIGELRVTTRENSTGTETELTPSTDFTATGIGSTGGGTITLTAGNLASGYHLTIRRQLDLLQETDYRNQGAYYPETVETALDRGTMIDLQQQDELDRSLKAAETDSSPPSNLPVASQRAQKYLAFDENGDPVARAYGSISTDADIADNLAALRAITPTSGARVYVKAHTNEGDGGHGWFRGVTGAAAGTYTDDGGVTIVPTGGDGSAAWVRQFDGRVNLRFYVPGDGTDQSTGIASWLSYCHDNGVGGFAPAGNYALDPITQTMTANVDIQCERGAVFSYNSAQADPLFTFTAATRDLYRLQWVGGTIDNSDGEFLSANQSNTCLDVVRLKEVDISGVIFSGEATYDAASTSTTGTDTGVTPTDCKRVTITKCFFIGQGDAGVYTTGGATASDYSDDGGETIIANNHFYQCDQAATIKREQGRLIFSGNTVSSCRTGVTQLNVTGIDSGRASIITDNTFKKIETRAIQVQQGRGTVVANNIIEDWGYQSDGVTVGGIPKAIRLLGSSGCIVENNQVYLEEWADDASLYAIDVRNITTDLATYTADGNTIRGNKIHGVTNAIQEGSGAGANNYIRNGFSSVTTPYDANLLGNSSAHIVHENQGHQWAETGDSGNIGVGEDNLHSITVPGGTLNQDGRRLKVISFGRGANNSNPKTVTLYFGSTAILTTALTVSQQSQFAISADIIRDSPNSQKAQATIVQGGTTTLVDCELSGGLTETDANDIVIKVTGTVTDGGGGVNDNDILLSSTVVEVAS